MDDVCFQVPYIVYLVKQGIRLAELEQIIGDTDPATLAKYSRYSPEKKRLAHLGDQPDIPRTVKLKSRQQVGRWVWPPIVFFIRGKEPHDIKDNTI